MRLRTPAKVTLVLRVMDRRKDGYHDVQIALAPISLYDTLYIRTLPDKGLSLEVDSPEDLGPLEDNLVLRAARAFAEAATVEPRIALRLVKRIPSGAGLGGGSGNAAAALLVCNRLAGDPLNTKQLLDIAAKLGSDVPFFVQAVPAWAEGRGERLHRIEGLPPLQLLVVKPGFSSSTARAYRLLAESRATGPKPTPQPFPDLNTLDTVDGVAAALHNDFESVLFRSDPELAEIKARLTAEGARGALLSGSGSALFGIFTTEAGRNRAGERIARDGRWAVFPCETLAGHAYESES